MPWYAVVRPSSAFARHSDGVALVNNLGIDLSTPVTNMTDGEDDEELVQVPSQGTQGSSQFSDFASVTSDVAPTIYSGRARQPRAREASLQSVEPFLNEPRSRIFNLACTALRLNDFEIVALRLMPYQAPHDQWLGWIRRNIPSLQAGPDEMDSLFTGVEELAASIPI